MARSVLPALAVLALAAFAVAQLLGRAPGAFVAEPGAPRAPAAVRAPAGTAALGAAAGLLAAQPAHAGLVFDEVIPYAAVTSFSILWGIVLGFVLLRLQEAFPE